MSDAQAGRRSARTVVGGDGDTARHTWQMPWSIDPALRQTVQSVSAARRGGAVARGRSGMVWGKSFIRAALLDERSNGTPAHIPITGLRWPIFRRAFARAASGRTGMWERRRR